MRRGITFILSAVLFRIVPTALEISLVCGILVRGASTCVKPLPDLPRKTYNFGWNYAAITAVTMAAYTWFTVRTTSWRCVKLRL